ncbi:MAG: peptide-methionine (S)-S-oxide reductase MsrA [Myxococcales bacterium]|nr:peptide-methionine (S)-S-oxide reductase MsrA [Myxococcales bacterium]
MMRSLVLIPILLLGACSSPSADAPTTAPAATKAAGEGAEADQIAGARAAEAPKADSEAFFAGGCFWGVEHYMEQLDGVVSVESGYMGGHLDSPSYEQVTSHTTGHLETVRVRFDSRRVSYRDVAKLFFEIHDPTQADGQGPDIGPQYLSAVFVAEPAQEKIVQELIETLRGRGYDVVTQVRAAGPFWQAEDYHQDYYAKTGKTPYCHARVRRFGD